MVNRNLPIAAIRPVLISGMVSGLFAVAGCGSESQGLAGPESVPQAKVDKSKLTTADDLPPVRGRLHRARKAIR